MKPPPLLLAGAVFVAVLGGAACIAALATGGWKLRTTSEVDPAVRLSLRPRAAESGIRPPDIKGQRAFAIKAIEKAAASGAMVDAFGLWLIATNSIHAAEGETYESISSALGLADERFDLLSKSAMGLLDSVSREENSLYRTSTAIWTVWPILLTPEYRLDMAQKFGTRVQRLGSAGLDSTKQINDWAASMGFTGKPLVSSLSKREPLIGTTVARLKIPQGKGVRFVRGPKGLRMMGDVSMRPERTEQGGLIWASALLEGGRLRLLAGLPQGGITRQDASGLIARALAASPSEPGGEAVLPVLAMSATANAAAAAKAAGLGVLTDGPSDLRHLGMELRATSMPRILQAISIEIEPGADIPEERLKVVQTEADWCLLVIEDTLTGAILLGGAASRSTGQAQ